MPILNWEIEQLQSVMLIFTRMTAIFLTAPVLNTRRVPLHTKIGLSLMVALILGPIIQMTSAMPKETLPFAALVFKEAVVGLSIGFIANMIFAAVQMAGEIADMQSGFAFARLVDPHTGQRISVIGQFQIMMASLIFLGVDGHHILFSGLLDSYRVMPLG
ncbi:MAG: flagellar type III secretion system protein FliR, partial [Armatimonadetes bacterium]|nr:flagellar type III secretion system protein FliR [Armatimonadota bacterium]NIM24339.1 flagellar type III secretion system protein FliR [Armatimonadota bacterium]NIM68208.1 flagellar type III secretion system protein FliR [Armatimonadota bacterium]NIN06413.1 flagellar type III secretion system protein FliR [Armatimonadota bacterium]NIO97988.1 flagellar type III secretion system protein FliR [Armatimonadota bacterium]